MALIIIKIWLYYTPKKALQDVKLYFHYNFVLTQSLPAFWSLLLWRK